MKELSPEMLEEVFAQFNPSTLLTLLKFEGEDNAGDTHTLYYVNDYLLVESNGQMYQPAAFKANLAADSEEGLPSVVLTAPTADDQLVQQLRVFDKAPKVFTSMVVAERPNVVEVPESEFEVTSWTANADAIRITIETEPVLNEPIPGDIITPTLHPLLWENVVIKDGEE